MHASPAHPLGPRRLPHIADRTLTIPSVPTPDHRFAEALRHQQNGDPATAESQLRTLLQQSPRHTGALQALGTLHAQRGDFRAAAQWLKQAIKSAPKDPAPRFNLGNVLLQSGRLEQAEPHFRAAVKLDPRAAYAHHGLSSLLQARGKFAPAAHHARQAVALDPQFADAHNGLGTALKALGEWENAITALRTAVAIAPDHIQALTNLGNVLSETGALAEAITVYQTALHIHPQAAETLFNRGNTRVEQGALDDGEAAFQAARQINPRDMRFTRNHLFTMLYNPVHAPSRILAAHGEWGAEFQSRISPDPVTSHGLTDPAPLTVGLVSPDFRRHAVARFIEPLFAHADRKRIRICAYANVANPDDLTRRLRKQADLWRDIRTLDDTAAAQRIRADRVHILIDLAGHTAGSRLGLFALRPAPVQVTYLGYPATTGLPSMDYRITDAWTDPEPESAPCIETVVHVPGGFSCYRPDPALPEVAAAPCTRNGYITFGSLMNPLKVSDQVLGAWAEILRRTPDSHLLLCRERYRMAEVRARFETVFIAHGIAPERVHMEGEENMSTATFLSAYHRMDMALDTFPYAGHTTTCEALWMGVPTVTLAGDAFVGRVGVSVLSAVGMTDWIAESREHYVAIATRHAANPVEISRLRPGWRNTMAASPLCDEAGFSDRFATTLEGLWRQSQDRLT